MAIGPRTARERAATITGTADIGQAASGFERALAALRRGDAAAWQRELDAAARAGHPVAARLTVAAALRDAGPQAAVALLDRLRGAGPPAASEADYLLAELMRFHLAPPAPADWAGPLARAVLAGHAGAGQVMALYRHWGPGGGADTATRDVAVLAEALQRLDADWTPPPAQTVARRGAVLVERRPGFAPPALVTLIRSVLGPRLAPSLVVDPTSGERIRHPVRDNTLAQWLPDLLGWAGKLLDRRLAAAGGYAVDCGEVPNLLRYLPGQQYRPHMDCLPPAQLARPEAADEGGQRWLTQLLGLGDDAFVGGETVFPALGIEVQLGAGELLAFTSADAEGRPLADSRHAGRPVERGEKWVLSKWVRRAPTAYGRALPRFL